MRRALVSIFRRIEGWSRNAERQELYSQFAAFGRGSRIDLPVHVLNPKHIYVGSRVLVHPYCRLEAVTEWKPGGVAGFTPRLEIEDDVMIQYAVHIGCNHHVRIGARTGIGSRCFITDHEHVFEDPEAAPLYQGITHGRETILEEDCYLGEGVVVLAGVRIGRHSVIGSNSVVNRDIPPYSIALGVPARVVRQYDREQRSWKTRVG
jgi:acetyltransferase-like isoleucine patch superfamily enzyme